MTQYTLRTLGGLALEGPNGPLVVGDPIALGALCLAALAPGGSVDESEALLRLTPDLTPAEGRARLTGAVETVTAAAGAPVMALANGRLTVDLARLACDVELGDGSGGGPAARRFLAGFDLPESPEFQEWVAATRPRVRIRTEVAADARGPRFTLAAIGGVAVLATVAAYALRTRAPSDFNRGDAIVLADLDNTTGDTLFDRSLITAAAVGLRQSPQLSLLPQGRITGALRRMGFDRPDTVAFTLARAKEVGVREQARYAIGFRLEPAGSGYRLSVQVANSETGTVAIHSDASAETKAGAIIALDRLLQDVRAGLGERRSERRARTVALPEATTTSIEALRNYAMGSAAWSRQNYHMAQELWARAVDLDTGFAMAMGALGRYSYYHQDRAVGYRYYTEALKRTGRLTEWERLQLASNFASDRQRPDSAIALGRLIVERYPSAASWYSYGTELLSFGRPAEAIAALEQALRFDSVSVNTHINLATAAKTLGRNAVALGHYEQAGRIDSLILIRGNVANEYAGLLVAENRLADADAVYRRMLARTDLYDRGLGYRGLGFLLVWQGRLDEAVGAFRQAIDAARQQTERGQTSLVRGYLFEALTLLLIGEHAEADRALDRAVENLGPLISPGFRALLGYGLVRAGRIPEAEKLADGIHAIMDSLNRTDREAAAFLDAELLAAKGRADSATALLATAAGGQIKQLISFRRVAALANAGKIDPARRLADSVLAGPAFGSEAEFELFWTMVLSGDLEAKAGNAAGARARYGRLIDQWTRGDSTSLLLATARRRVAEPAAVR